MEETKKLAPLAKKFETTLAQAEKATTFQEADQAKMASLKIWRELQRQLNRAYREITTLPREARARITENIYKGAQNKVIAVEAEPASVGEATTQKPKDQAADPAQKPKETTKKSKKAKK